METFSNIHALFTFFVTAFLAFITFIWAVIFSTGAVICANANICAVSLSGISICFIVVACVSFAAFEFDNNRNI